MIIGISGYAGSGKDTIAKIIQYTSYCQRFPHNIRTFEDWSTNVKTDSKWEIKKWAGKLKQIASILTGIPVENFEDQEFKKTEMGAMWGMSVREFLQKLGTDGLRDGLHKEVWVNALMSDYKVKKKEGGFQRTVKSAEGIPYDFEYEVEYPNWIISDTRFPNEAEAIKEQGGIIVRVNRLQKQYKSVGIHPSETALDNWDFDTEIHNTRTVDDLIPKVKWIMETYNLL